MRNNKVKKIFCRAAFKAALQNSYYVSFFRTISTVILLAISTTLNFSCSSTTIKSENTPSERIIARIGNEQITEGDIMRRIQSAYGDIDKSQISEVEWKALTEEALEAEIIDRMLYLAAEEEGINVTKRRLDELFRESVELIGEKNFKEMLKERNLSEADFKEFLRKREIINKYKEKMFKGIEISEEEMRDYYSGHRSDFIYPETVKMEIYEVNSIKSGEDIFNDIKLGIHSKI